MTRRACFLDRDGVILDLLPDGTSVRTPDQVRLATGAADAIRDLRAAGLVVVVVTNQPGPAKGQYTAASVHGAMARMHALLAAAGTRVDDVLICWHHPEGGPGGDPTLVMECACRKPKPGLLLEAARKHDLDLAGSFLIGDRDSDAEAGRAAGCRTVQVGAPGIPGLTEAAQRVLGWLAGRG
ncbi:MAG TPA: HAD family hydrolase [Polyangia bacterium]|nr:HAD family hydrolase [Polyangia bacterium]